MEVPFKVRSSSNWKFSRVPICKRMCHEFEGCCIPFYSCIFEKLWARLPLTTFEKEILDHLCISLSQLHPCVWGFMRVFEYWYKYQGNMDSTSLNLFFHLFEDLLDGYLINPLYMCRGHCKNSHRLQRI